MSSVVRASARAIRERARPSPGSGHGCVCWPRRCASQHFRSAFARVPMNLNVALVMARWQRLVGLDVPKALESNSPAAVSRAWSTARAPTHCRHVAMPTQDVIGFGHPPAATSGQAATSPQPVAASGRSSVSPQSRLAPPQLRLMSAKSATRSASRARAVMGSAVQESPDADSPRGLAVQAACQSPGTSFDICRRGTGDGPLAVDGVGLGGGRRGKPGGDHRHERCHAPRAPLDHAATSAERGRPRRHPLTPTRRMFPSRVCSVTEA